VTLNADDAFWDGHSIWRHALVASISKFSGDTLQPTTDAAVERREKVLVLVVRTPSAKMT